MVQVLETTRSAVVVPNASKGRVIDVSEARSVTRPLAIYAWSLAVIGTWCAGGIVASLPAASHQSVFIFLVLSVWVAESLAIDLPGQGSTALGYPMTIAMAVLFGPAGAGLAASLGAFAWADLRRSRPATHTALNFGQLAISASAAGWVYLWLGGADSCS